MPIKKSITAIAGLPSSGKSTVGEQLSNIIDATFLDVDDARQAVASGNAWLGPEKEREIMLAAYEHNHRQALKLLETGEAVILAATYSRPIYHQMLRELSLTADVPLLVFLLQIDDRVATRRLEQRKEQKSKSNVTTLESYQEVKHRYIPFPEAIVLDSSTPIEKTSQFILDGLTRLNLIQT